MNPSVSVNKASALPATGGLARAGRAAGPITVLMNPRAGHADHAAYWRRVETVLRRYGREPQFVAIEPGQDLSQACRRVAEDLRSADGVLVAAGGDGTVNAVAQVCRSVGLPLGVLPLGTFNYFARRHAIPLEPEAAAQLLVDGTLQAVQVGEVNGRLFLNNASFGLYNQWISQRERLKAVLGRFRGVALASGLLALLQGQHPFTVRVLHGGGAQPLRTAMVFVANNPLQLEALGLDAAACTRAGALGVIVLRPSGLGDRLRLLLRTALKDLDEDERLEHFCTTGFEVESQRARMSLVVDGELLRMQTPLRFRVRPQALQVIVPAPAA